MRDGITRERKEKRPQISIPHKEIKRKSIVSFRYYYVIYEGGLLLTRFPLSSLATPLFSSISRFPIYIVSCCPRYQPSYPPPIPPFRLLSHHLASSLPPQEDRLVSKGLLFVLPPPPLSVLPSVIPPSFALLVCAWCDSLSRRELREQEKEEGGEVFACRERDQE